MSDQQIPKHYQSLKRRFPDLIRAIEVLGETAKRAGPLSPKTAHLIQMAAAAAVRSEGAVHSHARRAIEAGATDFLVRSHRLEDRVSTQIHKIRRIVALRYTARTPSYKQSRRNQ